MYRVDDKGRSDDHLSDREEAPMERWFETINNLEMLGCGFMAIYGAEPAQVPDRIAQFLHYAWNASIPNSVITSGVGLDEAMLDFWWDAKLRSLTMSVDALVDEIATQASNKSSRIKTDKAYHYLSYFIDKYGKHPEFRDVEACMTLTRKNFRALPTLIEALSEKGIWLHWDLVHADRGQPYSKVETVSDLAELTFREEDKEELRDVLSSVKALKDKGCLIHPGKQTIDMMGSDEGLAYRWQCCSMKEEFVGMVTLDVNCVVRPCDDFLPPEMDVSPTHATASPQRLGQTIGKGKIRLPLAEVEAKLAKVVSTPIFGWELSNRWEEYIQRTREMVRKYDCRCSWATHMSAEQIYNGVGEDLAHYIHSRISDLP
jgi:hypothetical protein